MTAKVLRASYYWSTVHGDYTDFVRKCIKCQEYDSSTLQRPENLHYILSPWPFVKWGMDIIRLHLLMGIDYFIKWIKVEPLAAITTQNVQNFFWKSIVCCFGIPHAIITNNGREFTNQDWLSFTKSLISNISQVQWSTCKPTWSSLVGLPMYTTINYAGNPIQPDL